jgi:hypothetical protein
MCGQAARRKKRLTKPKTLVLAVGVTRHEGATARARTLAVPRTPPVGDGRLGVSTRCGWGRGALEGAVTKRS